MNILCVTAMPKSGKGVLSDALVDLGWTHISMSGILREHIKHDLGLQDEDVTRAIMFKGGSFYRKHYGGGYAARLCLEEIDKLLPEKRQKVIIDGIRHPGEISVLNKLNGICGINVYFAGIIADDNFKVDHEIRLNRLKNDPEQRGAKGQYESAEIFDWIDYYEWDMSPFGLMVGPCLDRVRNMPNGSILKNNRDEEKWKKKVQYYIQSLEGQSRSPERCY